MINNIKQTLQSAIETLSVVDKKLPVYPNYKKVIAECKTALSELDNAETIYLARRIGTGLDYFTCNKQRFDELNVNKLFHTKIAYTSPQPREWVDIDYKTRRELYKSVDKGDVNGFADALSEKLRELNTKG